MPEVASGLQGVVVAESAMSKVFGEEGNLIYRGFSIHDLAKYSTFEEVIFLLWNGHLPKQEELDHLKASMIADRAVPQPVLDYIRSAPDDDSMAMLRTAVSMLSAFDEDSEDYSLPAAERKARRLTASMATLVAAIGRAKEGQQAIAPDPTLDHAANFLYMMLGQRPNAAASRLMDQALVLHADHGFNASTFSARVTTSTLADMHSAVVSAIGTLKGASHGGANMRVMQMLVEIDASGQDAEAWVMEALAAKKRIMGFGHRVYKVEDPRATHLRGSARELAGIQNDDKWFRLSERVEKAVLEQKGLYPNVDFYSASSYYMLDIPTHLFTPVFAVSRIGGWSAHILEQTQNNRLIRPRSDYTGGTDKVYVRISDR